MTERLPHNPDREPVAPTLGDVLRLEAAVESADQRVDKSSFLAEFEGAQKDISSTESIAIHYVPYGIDTPEGKIISSISLRQRIPDGTNKTVMNYIIFRDGDETTTRLIKRPPFELPNLSKIIQIVDPNAMYEAAMKEANDFAEKYQDAKRLGLYDVTVEEVNDLVKLIDEKF